MTTQRPSHKELHKIMQAELEDADNNVSNLMYQAEELQKQVDYWKRQADALRTVVARYAFGPTKEE